MKRKIAGRDRRRFIGLAGVPDELALIAADLSLEHKLPMADAIVLATARLYDAEVVTSDADFDGLGGVTYIPKPKTE